MKIKKLSVNTYSQNYRILIGSNLISKLSVLLKKNSINFKKCLLLVDKNIPKNYVSKIKNSLSNKNREIHISFIRATESNKNQKNINNILETLLKKNFSRKDCLVSVGGGITGDMGGFAASIFKRGLTFLNLPTTLLSQVDSSVGGKTGINSIYGKNSIGSFYQPKIVISDVDFLKTLPKREIICGYGEILKHSLIANKKFYIFLNKNSEEILKLSSPFIEKAIYESCKIKKKVVEKDEKEKGLRKILNFGHTFAHAYEASLGYSKRLNHGEAVILGLKTALNFSLKRNLIKKNEHNSIINHIYNCNLPSELKEYFRINDTKKIIKFMLKDKKNNSDKISLVLLKKIGAPLIDQKYTKENLGLFLKGELSN